MRNITKNFDTEIIAVALFKELKVAARIFLAKKSPSPSSLFMEQLFSATHSSKVKFLKRASKQPRAPHSFLFKSFFQDTRLILFIEFLFSRHKIHPLRLIVDFKVRHQDDASE